MGRVKLDIKKIENTTNRQVTFSKRRNGLIKKAYELSILCDIDIALIMFSPSSRLINFSSRKRIEDVLSRYIGLSGQERLHAVTYQEQRGLAEIQNVEELLRNLQKLRNESNVPLPFANPAARNTEIEGLQQEIARLQQQLHMAHEQITIYEPDPTKITSIEELQSYEKHLSETLTQVMQTKEYLLSNHASTYDPTLIQHGMPPCSTTSWLPDVLQDHCHSHILPTMDQNQTQFTGCFCSPEYSKDATPAETQMSTWLPLYASTELHSIVAPLLYPQIQQGTMGIDLPEMMPREQVEIPINSPHLQMDSEGANYENIS